MSTKVTVYEDGKKVKGSHSLDDAIKASKDRKGVAWISLVEPTEDKIALVKQKFGLEGLTSKGTEDRKQTESKDHEPTLVLSVSPASYVEGSSTVKLGELRIYSREQLAVTISRGVSPDLQGVESDIEANPDLEKLGGGAVLSTLLYQILEDYDPVVDGIGDDLTDLEAAVLGRSGGATEKIYELMREVATFQRSTGHLADVLDRLADSNPWDSGTASTLEKRLSGARSRARRTDSRVSGFVSLLQNLLSVNLTLVSIQQNDQTRKISAWAAILAVPTIVGGIYGMNFRYMPELHWLLGYPFSLLVMVTICFVLYLVFKRVGWL